MNGLQQTALIIEGRSGVYYCDTIIYKNEPWIVLSWIRLQVGEPERPERIVRLAALKHQYCPDAHDYQYMINDPLPKSLFSGVNIPKHLEESVIDLPEVSIRVGNA